MSMYFYRPQRSWGKVIFSQASVILLTGGGLLRGVLPPGGGECILVCSQGGVVENPPGRYCAVRILLECILVKQKQRP